MNGGLAKSLLRRHVLGSGWSGGKSGKGEAVMKMMKMKMMATRTTRRDVVLGSCSAAVSQGRASGRGPSKRPPIVYHEDYSLPQLPPGHTFPMRVFERIYSKLVSADIARVGDNVFSPELDEAALLRDHVSLVHCDAYAARFAEGRLSTAEARRMGLPWSPQLVRRTLAELSGTMLTADLALDAGLALSCAGGTHHAHRDFGSGFCIFNDLAITARHVLRYHSSRIRKVLILDLDVHQGDGTAAIFSPGARSEEEKRAKRAREDAILAGILGRHAENADGILERVFDTDKSVLTVSVHAQSNFPSRKQHSDLDLGLPANTEDQEYLTLLSKVLTTSLATYQPDLVLYDAGVDIHVEDSLGHLAITDGGIFRRDSAVIDTCLAFGTPCAAYVGGGYASDLDTLAGRHCLLFEAAAQLYQQHHSVSTGENV